MWDGMEIIGDGAAPKKRAACTVHGVHKTPDSFALWFVTAQASILLLYCNFHRRHLYCGSTCLYPVSPHNQYSTLIKLFNVHMYEYEVDSLECISSNQLEC